MPHRQFRDEKQVNWEVWDVHPGEVARRLRTDREPALTARGTVADLPKAAVARDLAQGWLCFESMELKRRLWPIPNGWERMDELQLATLCSQAKDAPAR